MTKNKLTTSQPLVSHYVTLTQARYRGWSLRTHMSVAHSHYQDNCTRIELMIQAVYQEYEYSQTRFTERKLVCSIMHDSSMKFSDLEKSYQQSRIDAIGNIPLFGFYLKKTIRNSDGKSIIDTPSVQIQKDSLASQSAKDEDREDDTPDISHPSADSEIDITLTCSQLVDPKQMTHVSNSGILRDEANWLEAAIRQRITVRPFIAASCETIPYSQFFFYCRACALIKHDTTRWAIHERFPPN